MTNEELEKLRRFMQEYTARYHYASDNYRNKVSFGYKQFPREVQQEMLAWCKENCVGRWDGFTILVTLFFFEEVGDAIQFKLRWGGDGVS